MPIVQNDTDFAKRVRRFLVKWRDAKLDPEAGELSLHEHGDYTHGPYWDHGWWMAPRDWSLGASVDWEEWRGRDRYSLTFEIGPFAWAINFYPWGGVR